MKECYQTESQNVYEHGLSVWHQCQNLLDGKHDGMKIPTWFDEWKKHEIHSKEIIEDYTVFHDIGKTRCLTIDDQGRRHFPNHAALSEEMWLEYGGDPLVGSLIGLDMIFHTETPEQILSRNLDSKTLCTLMLVALAELHANASMFGGITSESFCIKFKRLNKRATRILKTLAE